RRDYVVRAAAPGSRRRRRQRVRAVDEISLRIERGEAVGFVGANGAGKSTTIKMITGILQPTAGSVRVLGRDPVPERPRLAREIGVVFGQRSQLWWDLPLRDSYRILGAMHRLTDRALAARLDRLVEGLDLAGFLDRPVRQLSLGQRMRGEVAAALLHSPALVVLDEPTIGWTWSPRRVCVASCARTGPSAAPPCSSPPTTWATSSGCATGSWWSPPGRSPTTARSPASGSGSARRASSCSTSPRRVSRRSRCPRGRGPSRSRRRGSVTGSRSPGRS